MGDVVDFVGETVGGVVGGLTGATAAAEAATEGARLSAGATAAASKENIEFQKWLWGEQKALAQPYASMGAGAIPQYQELLGQPIDVTEDPSYQFRLGEGQRARETSAAAKGMQLSGAQSRAMERFGQDYASQEYGQAFNRRQVGLDNLYRMIMSGKAAAAGQAQTGTAMGSQVSGAISEGGRAQSQMYSDIGNIQASQAMSGFNTLLDVGNLAATYYGAKAGATPAPTGAA